MDLGATLISVPHAEQHREETKRGLAPLAWSVSPSRRAVLTAVEAHIQAAVSLTRAVEPHIRKAVEAHIQAAVAPKQLGLVAQLGVRSQVVATVAERQRCIRQPEASLEEEGVEAADLP